MMSKNTLCDSNLRRVFVTHILTCKYSDFITLNRHSFCGKRLPEIPAIEDVGVILGTRIGFGSVWARMNFAEN
jgi:hypothetical protein